MFWICNTSNHLVCESTTTSNMRRTKGPPKSIGSMDLLYTLTDGVVPLLVHVDLPDMNKSVLPSSLDLHP